MEPMFRKPTRAKMNKFKPHMMYDKSGKGYKADTYEQHLAMKKKGYGHSKPSKAKADPSKAKAEKRVKKLIRKKSGY
jgi:hypothetical protein